MHLKCGIVGDTDQRSQGDTYRSVTMSKTAPNLDAWPNARAACPSSASRRQDMQYASVQYFGWKLM